MGSTLPIGDFARATHLSVKALRHYHQVGLLEPVDIDPVTGYRRYATRQIPTAQAIRRFRALDMPIAEIHAVLTAPDPPARDALIATHLARMEADLVRTQDAVASLRDLLEHPDAVGSIGQRRAEAVTAAAVSEVIDIADSLLWYQGALGELRATVVAQGVRPSGPSGGVFSGDLFADERGPVTIFIPCEGELRPMGRVAPLVVPAAELATIVHIGPHTDIDRAYGALATYVSNHALAVDGPIREYYLIGPTDTSEESAWRTEIAWPIVADA